MTPADSHVAVPELLGRFRIYERLGEGAIGAVYRTVDTAIGTTVAVKILNERTARNPSMIRRFSKESRILSKVDSTFVARLIDSNHDQDIHFLAQEYLPGGSLPSVIRSGGRFPSR